MEGTDGYGGPNYKGVPIVTKGNDVSESAFSDGLVLPPLASRAQLGDEIVFTGGKHADGKSIQEGVITLISLKGVQVMRKVSIGQNKEQLFVKWDKVVRLGKAS